MKCEHRPRRPSRECRAGCSSSGTGEAWQQRSSAERLSRAGSTMQAKGSLPFLGPWRQTANQLGKQPPPGHPPAPTLGRHLRCAQGDHVRGRGGSCSLRCSTFIFMAARTAVRAPRPTAPGGDRARGGREPRLWSERAACYPPHYDAEHPRDGQSAGGHVRTAEYCRDPPSRGWR